LQNTDLSQYLEKHTGGLNPRNVKVSKQTSFYTSLMQEVTIYVQI